MIDLNNHKLELEYPCLWKYKIVIFEDKDPKKIVNDIFNERQYKITLSNVSKNKKFASYNIELTVNSDDDRMNLHQRLGEKQDIQMVL